MMLKRKWAPLSPQVRIAETLNIAPAGLSMPSLQAHDFLRGLSPHSLAVNLRMLAKRGEVADHAANGVRVFVLTPRGQVQLDFHRMARDRLARRLRMEIPAGTYPAAPAASTVTPRSTESAGATHRIDNEEKRAEPETSTTVTAASISRAHLRLIVNRAIANPLPLSEGDSAALAAAIKEVA